MQFSRWINMSKIITWDVNVYNQTSMNHSSGIWPETVVACGVSTLLHSKPGFPHFTSLRSLTLKDPAFQELRALPKFPHPRFSFFWSVYFSFILFLFVHLCISCVCLLFVYFERGNVTSMCNFCYPTLHLNLLEHSFVLYFPSPINFLSHSFFFFLDKDSSSCAMRVSWLY